MYRLEKTEKLVTNKLLSQRLGVSAPSVSEMLVVLQKDGSIHYTPYKGSVLTDKGRKKAESVLHNHHVWEHFLIDCLEYSKEEAHVIAHQLEHVSGTNLIQRLENYLECL